MLAAPAAFQSLVGTLKTAIGAHFWLSELAFQSLVGTLKTTFAFALCWRQSEFQSLVGTLKTVVELGVYVSDT